MIHLPVPGIHARHMHDPTLPDPIRECTAWERNCRNAQVRFLDSSAAAKRMAETNERLDEGLLLELECTLRASHVYYRAYTNMAQVTKLSVTYARNPIVFRSGVK
jgi:hypothetical protein